MHKQTDRHRNERTPTTVARAASLALAAGAILFVSTAVGAESLCSLSPGSKVAYGYLAMPLNQGSTGVRHAPVTLRLRAKVASDGSSEVRGAIRVRASGRLRAIPSSAAASCGDSDGDLTTGLVRLAADFRHVKTGERVSVMLTTPGQDIDTTGRYLVTVQIGADMFTVEAKVRVSQSR